MTATTPAALRTVESFLNSVDAEVPSDEFADVDTFRGWLTGQGFADDTATAADLELARALRAELRAEVDTHHDGTDRDRSTLDALAARVPLTVRFAADGSARPAPTTSGGVTGLLGEVLAAVSLATHDGTWSRLKICPASDCRWVYYDVSRNSSRRWCAMRTCGNRNKTRTYRRRAATS